MRRDAKQLLKCILVHVPDAELERGLDISDVNKNLDKYVVDTNAQFEDESRLIYNWVAGTFVLAASTLSVRNAYSHVRHWNKPSVQRKILVVIWMVPVYGATSIGALVYPRFGSDLALARDL